MWATDRQPNKKMNQQEQLNITEIVKRYEHWLKNGIIYFNPYYKNPTEWIASVKAKVEELKRKIKK